MRPNIYFLLRKIRLLSWPVLRKSETKTFTTTTAWHAKPAISLTRSLYSEIGLTLFFRFVRRRRRYTIDFGVAPECIRRVCEIYPRISRWNFRF